jgi:transcriptional regulator with XRE-family HTH domain
VWPLSESPAVARRRLRLALRRAREAKGFTQFKVADALEWSLSKVNRIESGEVTVSGTDLRALLTLLEVADPATVERLTTEARVARLRSPWDVAHLREHLTPATHQMLQFESDARSIRSFQPTLVPGLFQTRDYAAAVLDVWSDELSRPAWAARLEVRLQRAELLHRADPPGYALILDESAVMREVGGPRVMCEQLQQLLELIRDDRVTTRVLPLADAALMVMNGPFIIFDLGDDDVVIYRERPPADDIVDASHEVERYTRLFQRMWNKSLNEDASRRLIEARAAALLTDLDRGSSATPRQDRGG